jgi:hypothetical protein
MSYEEPNTAHLPTDGPSSADGIPQMADVSSAGDVLHELTQEELVEIVLRQEAMIRRQVVEESRGRRWWPEDRFCHQCGGPYLYSEGRRTSCLLCDR